VKSSGIKEKLKRHLKGIPALELISIINDDVFFGCRWFENSPEGLSATDRSGASGTVAPGNPPVQAASTVLSDPSTPLWLSAVTF
jgi:hypothetical protein